MNDTETFKRAALYNICSNSPVLRYINLNDVDTETLQAVVNQSFSYSVDEIVILLSKYATKSVLSLLVSKYPNIGNIIKPDNIKIRVEDDERAQIFKRKKASEIPVYGLVIKNIVIGLLNTNVENLGTTLNDLEQLKNVQQNTTAPLSSPPFSSSPSSESLSSAYPKPPALITPLSVVSKNIQNEKENLVKRVPVTNSILLKKPNVETIREKNRLALNERRTNDKDKILQEKRKVRFAEDVREHPTDSDIDRKLNSLTFNIKNVQLGEEFINALQIHSEGGEYIADDDGESMIITELSPQHESESAPENNANVSCGEKEELSRKEEGADVVEYLLTPPPSVHYLHGDENDKSTYFVDERNVRERSVERDLDTVDKNFNDSNKEDPTPLPEETSGKETTVEEESVEGITATNVNEGTATNGIDDENINQEEKKGDGDNCDSEEENNTDDDDDDLSDDLSEDEDEKDFGF